MRAYDTLLCLWMLDKITAKKDGDSRTLADEFPKIAADWDYEANEDEPSDYAPFSRHVAYWICPKGHKYSKIISRRTKHGDGCPICSGNLVVEGINDLGSLRPDLMLEWDFDKNYAIFPSEVTVMSNRKAWWKCSDCGNSWEAPISNRTRGSGCPKCRYKRAVATRRGKRVRYNKPFGEEFPMLLKEWDYSKNQEICDPMKVTRGSGKRVWWKCSQCGHEWVTTVNNRSRGSGCFVCSHFADKRRKG